MSVLLSRSIICLLSAFGVRLPVDAMSAADPHTPRQPDVGALPAQSFSGESPGLAARVVNRNLENAPSMSEPEFTSKDLYAIWKQTVFEPLGDRGMDSSTFPDVVMSALSACRRALAHVRRRIPVSAATCQILCCHTELIFVSLVACKRSRSPLDCFLHHILNFKFAYS